jgi:hypothetical protein
MKTLSLSKGQWSYEESVRLGELGGFASVHAGWSATHQPVAIKVFHPGAASERELAFASERVGKTSAHVVEILDQGVDPATSQAAIVMAKADASLAHFLKVNGPLSERAACDVVLSLTEGLLEVPNWIHRDLKPANALRCNGVWQLTDFGIARVADAHTSVGTMKGFLSVHYAAPEQWNNERATHKTDVYALGCVLYELMTGKPPFQGPLQEDLARQHRSEVPAITTGSDTLRSFLLKMLAKPQEGRPSLEIVRDRMRSMSSPTRNSSAAASALAAVSAAVSVEQAQAEAAATEAARLAETRRSLTQHAQRTLRETGAALFERIQEHAPAAVVSQTGTPQSSVRQAALGKGWVKMSLGRMLNVESHLFGQSRWNVLCWDTIECHNPGYARSASLLFMQSSSDAEWRWHEVAYHKMWGPSEGDSPCFLKPGVDADLAASMTMHTWSLAHPPRFIDDEERESFVERWINHFGAAAQGQLRRPTSIPEP